MKTMRWSIWSMLLISCIGCNRPQKDEVSLIPVKGPAALLRVMPGDAPSGYYADSGRFAYFPFQAGDVYFQPGDEEQFFLRYEKGMPDSLQFELTDSLVYLNKNLFQVRLGEGTDMLPALNALTDADKRNLKNFWIRGNLPASYHQALEAIGNINPSVNLHLEPDSSSITIEQLHWLASHFKPKLLIVEMDTSLLEVLSAFQGLEQLHLSVSIDSARGEVPPLPNISSLKSITVDVDQEDNLHTSTSFFAKNPQLESITIKSQDLLKELLKKGSPVLEKLYLAGNDTLTSLPYGEHWPKLQTLHILSPLSGGFNLADLTTGQKLKELGLNGSLDQQRFNQILAYQTELERLEIQSPDTLIANNYAALTNLKKLRYLTLGEKTGDTKPIETMKQLLFLSVPREDAADSLKLAALEKALPDTKVTPNGGFCMGTGWILLGIPVMIVSMLFFRRRKRNSVNLAIHQHS